MASLCEPEVFGADPVSLKWQVVRGDTATMRVEFLENDEATPFPTGDWEFAATTYDLRGDVLDELIVNAGNGYVDITAPAEITEFWGAGYGKVVAELAFDLQVTVDAETIWTPVIGTINVLGDVTGGL